ncbi:MAG: sensor histidine kinase [Bacteriovoracaceae bacterium]
MRLSNILNPTFLNNRISNLSPKEQKLFWLVRLRIMALFFQMPLTLIGRYYGYLNQSSHIVFTVCLITLLAYNANLYRRLAYKENKEITDFHLTLQISFDLIAFTILLSLSGSSNNPFYGFFYVMAVLGGIFSSGKSSKFFGITLILCVLFIQIQPTFYSNAAFDTIFSLQTFPYLLSQIFIATVTYLIARSFGELFNDQQKRLLALTIHTERLDRLRALGSLSAGFSHEFATPLQNAKLRLNRYLQSSNMNREELEECKLSLNDCEDVLRRMNFAQLNFSEQDFEIIQIEEVTEEAINAWKETSPTSHVRFFPSSGHVQINRINFVQSIFNLMDNAAEATNQNSEITVKILSEENTIKLLICDTGPGLSKEVLERLGEPFNTTKEKGTGLGIYSTQLFMNSVGGSLQIKNHPQTGTIVELIFPKVELE